MSKKLGLIGAGLMGLPMAKNWRKAGYPLCVLPNKSQKPIEELVSLGSTKAANYEELCKNSDVIFLMVPTSREVEQNCEALEPFLTPEHLVVDMTTSEPSSTKVIYEKFSKKNLRFMDCPVTGGVVGAEKGTLTLFMGGPKSWIDEVLPALKAISKIQQHFGDVGSGHTAKVINNFICIGNLAVYAQALPLGIKMGLDSKQLFETLMGGTARSFMLSFYGPQILEGDFAPRFKMAHAFKDIKLAHQAAEENGQSLPLLESIIEAFTQAEKMDLMGENISALIKPYEKQAEALFRNS